MADDEHVAMLKKGVAAWNAWRGANADIRPDLKEANLSGADLRGRSSARRCRRQPGVLSRRAVLREPCAS
jgi:uncharacterized protein YjbI with pentapeptide repeats